MILLCICLSFTGMHAFFGSDCWSTFGVQTVEWAIQRIINSLNADRVEQDAQ